MASYEIKTLREDAHSAQRNRAALAAALRRECAPSAHFLGETDQMKYITGTKEFQIDRPTAVTLGKFDGLHRGHRKLLEQVFACREQGLASAVFTFGTPPLELTKGKPQTMITTNGERMENLRNAGVDYLVEFPFDMATAGTEPEEFVRDILVGKMRAKAIVSGTDFHFGHNRRGDVELLKELAPRYGYTAYVVEKAHDGDRVISSTYVREMLAEGNIRKANELLGYEYSISGQVVHGKHLGTTLGFPTVNIIPPAAKHLPKFGVYVSRVEIDGEQFYGITNIGRKPTIKGEFPAGVETYIYGVSGDLYGKRIRVSLVDFLRPEMKFESVEQLKAQVQSDKEAVRRRVEREQQTDRE